MNKILLKDQTHCGRCMNPIKPREPRAIVRDVGSIISLCVPCVNREYENADAVPLYTSRGDYERKMIAQFGRE